MRERERERVRERWIERDERERRFKCLKGTQFACLKEYAFNI